MGKKCYRCKQDVPADVFHYIRNVSKPDGFDHICKACRKAAREKKKQDKLDLARDEKIFAEAWRILSKAVEDELGLPEMVSASLEKARSVLPPGQESISELN